MVVGKLIKKTVDYFPHTAHQTAHFLLSVYSTYTKIKKPVIWEPVRWNDLYFPNPLGPAGGMDKSAQQVKAWWALGAGFVEVGTITPCHKKKNPGLTVKRSFSQKTLWNHLGFPGAGALTVQKRLKYLKGFSPTPILANIGKNRSTPNERAEEDYQKCIALLSPYVSAFVINVSSPNTPNLTDLTEHRRLKTLLKAIQKALNGFEKKKPFLIKWGPDMSSDDFLRAVDVALECGAEGHIICNSSKKKEVGIYLSR